MASAICLARVRLPALSWRYVAHQGLVRRLASVCAPLFYFGQLPGFSAVGVRLGWGWRVEFFGRK